MKSAMSPSMIIFTLLIAAAQSSGRQSSPDKVGRPWIGGSGVTVSVADLKARSSSTPVPFIREQEEAISHARHPSGQAPGAPYTSQWPRTSKHRDGLTSTMGLLSPQSIGVDFRAQKDGQDIPPDCDGAVGPSQILVCTNDFIQTFTKSGAQDFAIMMTTESFFSQVDQPTDTGYASDPHVIFDRLSQRWFIVAANYYLNTRPNRILIAVSSGATITPTSTFTFFEFRQDSVGGFPNSDTSAILDYPTFGLDANALYIGGNIFHIPLGGNSFVGSSAFVVRKSSVLGSGPIVVTAFRHLCSDTTHGPFSPQGACNDDTSATEGYFIGIDAVSFGLLQMRRVTDPGGTPSMSGNLSITTPATYTPSNVPAKGSTHPISPLDDRLGIVSIRDGNLWTAHAIAVNSSGIADTSGSGRDGVRYYEITNLNSTPTLNQSGTLFNSASTNPLYYWDPSLAVSGQGHVAIGCSYAGVNDYAGVAYSGRLSADSPGTVQPPTVFPASYPYNYTEFQNLPYRWGDFSMTRVDPTDDMTMWTIQEYCDSTGPVPGKYAVRVTQLKAPPPPLLVSASPDSVPRGTSHDIVTVTASSSNGSGFYDPGSGFPQRLSVQISGGGVTVNQVTVTDQTHLTLDLAVDTGAATGGRTITVMNPDSQSVSSPANFIVIKIQSTTSINVSVSPDWNLISNPLAVANDSTTSLFPDAAGPSYDYNPGLGYEVSPRLINGTGYWLKFSSGGSAQITGYDILYDSVSVTDGWNLIGSIGHPVPTSSISSTPPGMITSRFFTYADGYTVSDTVKPGLGYWVKVTGSGRLILSSSGTTQLANRIRIIGTSDNPPPPPDDNVPATPAPKSYALEEAYPNPFNPATTIRYGLPTQSHVSLKIYNLLGQLVATLADKIEPAGYHQVEWNASTSASGVYFYRLDAVGINDPGKPFASVRKVLLIR